MANEPGQMVRTEIVIKYGHPVGEYAAKRIGQLELKEQVELNFLHLAGEAGRG